MTTKCIFTIEISINFLSLKNHRKSGHNTFYLYIKKQQFPCNMLLEICFNLNNNKRNILINSGVYFEVTDANYNTPPHVKEGNINPFTLPLQCDL